MPSTITSAAGIQDAARHLAEGRPAEAVAVLERLVADFPAYVTAHVLLAKAYEANGRDGDALEAWHHAYFLMPGSPLIVRERTRLLRIAPVAVPDAPSEQPAPSEPSAAEADEMPETVQEETGPEEPEAEPEDAEAAPETEAEVGRGGPKAGPDAESIPALDEGELGEVDDLDTLIHQLETAPRIRPDPNFRDEGLEDDEEEEGLVSETLARIYAAQKQYAEAARAYEQLAEQHPARADEFEAKAAEMRALAGEG